MAEWRRGLAGALGACCIAIAASPAHAGAQDADLAFSADDGIYTMRADGTGLRRLTPRPPRRSEAAGDSSPTWSPDGAWIAFASTGTATSEDAPAEIYVMDATGGQRRRITRNRSREGLPAWSPRGDRIAYVRDLPSRLVRSAIYTVGTDGRRSRRLTSGRFYDLSPVWSPDGEQVAFVRISVSRRGLGKAALMTVPAAGGTPVKIADNVGGDVAWSPARDRIAFTTDRDEFGMTCFHDCFFSSEIYTLALGGGVQTRITTSESNDDDVDWSPDGQVLAFVSDRSDVDDHDYEIYFMKPDGTCITPVTATSPNRWEFGPAWRPTADMSRVHLDCSG